MFAFSKIVRIMPRGLKMPERFFWSFLRQSRETQSAVRMHILPGHQALAAFPRGELPRCQMFQCEVPLRRLVQQRDVFDGQVVSMRNQVRMSLKKTQPIGRSGEASALFQLVPLVQYARIVWSEVKCTRKHFVGGLRAAVDIELCNTEIAEGNRECIVQLD